ncbi:MAG: hypothetical protein EAZ79_30520 [Oscillatoriales cyanobacterium]|nr:MAG: hypothetical protein EAZ79_30520 [Oscillatoriales cyanobacterium]TAF31715.1 MAG: hypothetical protein EAZ69_18970 [Oscillatoriales cyanobacterium]
MPVEISIHARDSCASRTALHNASRKVDRPFGQLLERSIARLDNYSKGRSPVWTISSKGRSHVWTITRKVDRPFGQFRQKVDRTFGQLLEMAIARLDN